MVVSESATYIISPASFFLIEQGGKCTSRRQRRSTQMERAMGIEPTQAVRSELENMWFGAMSDAKCD